MGPGATAAFKDVFSNIVRVERLMTVEQIYDTIRDPSVYCYSTFLNYILPHFTSVNVIFQSLPQSFISSAAKYAMFIGSCYLHKVAI